MDTTEFFIITGGRTTRLHRLIKQCGVYATACHLRNKGYSLQQVIALVSVSR